MNDQYGEYIDINIMGIMQRMRWIEPGRFLMGSPDDEPGRYGKECGIYNEGPQHEVRLSKGYWLFDTPVTQELWVAVMGDNPSYFKDDLKCPVESVTWNDAEQFLHRINERTDLDLVLPTEAQWEYACRAGTITPNYAGGEKDLEAIAWVNKNSYCKTHPVAMKKCNAWGLHDMFGNVLEWCADDLRKYSAEAVTDPVGPTDGAVRALRGGAWNDFLRFGRAAGRSAYNRDYRDSDIGFRCACAHSGKDAKEHDNFHDFLIDVIVKDDDNEVNQENVKIFNAAIEAGKATLARRRLQAAQNAVRNDKLKPS